MLGMIFAKESQKPSIGRGGDDPNLRLIFDGALGLLDFECNMFGQMPDSLRPTTKRNRPLAEIVPGHAVLVSLQIGGEFRGSDGIQKSVFEILFERFQLREIRPLPLLAGSLLGRD